MEFLFWGIYIFLSRVLIKIGLTLFSMEVYIYYIQIVVNLIMIIALRKYLPCYKEKKGLKKSDFSLYLFAMITGIGLCLSHRLIFIIFPQIGLYMLNNFSIEQLTAMDISTPGIILYVIFWAPITEELFFRGILFSACRKKHGFLYSTIVTSILFGITHMNLMQFVSALCMGSLIGLLIYLTDNIYIGIFVHIANNSFSRISQLFGLDTVGETYLDTFIFVVIGLILLLGGIFMIKKGNYDANTRSKYEKS